METPLHSEPGGVAKTSGRLRVGLIVFLALALGVVAVASVRADRVRKHALSEAGAMQLARVSYQAHGVTWAGHLHDTQWGAGAIIVKAGVSAGETVGPRFTMYFARGTLTGTLDSAGSVDVAPCLVAANLRWTRGTGALSGYRGSAGFTGFGHVDAHGVTHCTYDGQLYRTKGHH